MESAIEEAENARRLDEVPVGCVILDPDERIVARKHDLHRELADPLAHAEWLALRDAASGLGDWRLDGFTLVVTLEPCPMCAGAILMSRISRVIFGAASPKWGAAGTRADWLASGVFPHRPEVIGGIQAEDCGKLLSDYFREHRKG